MYEIKFRFDSRCIQRRLVFDDLWVAQQVWQKLADAGCIMDTEKPHDKT